VGEFHPYVKTKWRNNIPSAEWPVGAGEPRLKAGYQVPPDEEERKKGEGNSPEHGKPPVGQFKVQG
jgi:hypothetical protein